ncbi:MULTISPECIES: LamG-like jellyroll fold domain-containing protein [unclassified Modestobacter]
MTTATDDVRRPGPVAWRQGWTAFALSCLGRVALGALALLLTASVLPTLFGWQSSVVMSGSMEPALSPGDVAVVRPVDTAELRTGQVLLVDDPDSAGQLRLHRLVGVQAGGLQLRGDANPAVDGSLVDPSAVHGVVTVGLPLVGRPAVWLAEGRALPLVGTGVALLALLALATAHRRPDDDAPTPDGSLPSTRPGSRRPTLARRLRRGTVLTTAVLVTVTLPGSGAVFSDTTASPALTFPVAQWWGCSDVGGTSGARATHYYPLQDRSGTTVVNTGSAGSAANGTYRSAGMTKLVAGPPCGNGEEQAVRFDGASGAIWTTQPVTNPQTFSLQLWFSTTTGRGGKLIGFGNGTNGDLSSSYDRHVYLTDTGQLVFGVYNGTIYTVTSPRAYNDGAWHLVTATFSAASGMRLYVDGAQVATGTAPAAEAITGYWRIGHDNMNTWPSAPTSRYFSGALAHVSIYNSVLGANQVRDAWQITR